jgi:hypothetical protein
MYARTFGHLPAPDKGEIPWHKIGISNTFFQQRARYQPAAAATDGTLFPPDFKFFARYLPHTKLNDDEPSGAAMEHLAFTDGKRYELLEYERIKRHTIYRIREPLLLKISGQELTINNEMLAEYAHYPLHVAWIDDEIFGAVIYNIDSQPFQYNVAEYY